MNESTIRIQSIDIFRALTMLLMIFVNDLWTLKSIPKWMGHAEINEDMLGLADVVFPCFLFIVGMSVPFAVKNRIKKGDSDMEILWHILLRSLALIVMGIFTVNIPSMNAEFTGMGSEWFQIIMVSAFFLIWNIYPTSKGKEKYIYKGLQLAGIAVLLWLAFIFRGNKDGANEMTGMTVQWWGILGLIGWTYLAASVIYLFLRKWPAAMFSLWFFFIVFNIVATEGCLQIIFPGSNKSWFIGNGAFHSFAFAGIVATLLLEKYFSTDSTRRLGLIFFIISSVMLALGFITNQFWIISKLGETPPWIFFCCSIAFAFYALLQWLTDIKNKAGWFDMIKPAGTSTLTCYLIPYWYYSFMDLFAMELPAWVKTGGIGIVKSIIYSFIIIGITYVLGKMKIKLKI